MTLQPELFGLENKTEAVQLSFVTVGLWWLIFTIPLMLFIKEEKTQTHKINFLLIKNGTKKFLDFFWKFRTRKNLFLFLIAYWLYIDGVDTIIRMAVDYGLSLGMGSQDLIVALLMVQFIGFPAALAYGYFGQRLGAKRAIFIGITLYILITLWGAFMENKNEFFILAGLVGLVQGGIQALSRSYYARFIPQERSAEYFGIYNMMGKFAAIFGPSMMGLTGLLFRSMGFSSQMSSRFSILSLLILFVSGAYLLYLVDEEKATAEAKQ